MGLLKISKTLSWETAQEHRQRARKFGVAQFLRQFSRVKDIKKSELKWGDEVECAVWRLDHENKRVQLSLRGKEIQDLLNSKEEVSVVSEGASWHPEYGAWMVESIPQRPYLGFVSELLRCERNMILRRRRLLFACQENEVAPTLTCPFMLGTPDAIYPPPSDGTHGPVANSEYIPDSIINPHPRFAALTKAIRSRRGSNVNIQVPLFHDTNTPEFEGYASLEESKTVSSFKEEAKKEEEEERTTQWNRRDEWEAEHYPHIHMDAMAFGMGCCCLQVTFQARDVNESRYLYDNLSTIGPIMLALSAATPIFKGRLSDIDTRWRVISQSVDDRTPAERGEVPEDELQDHYDPHLVGGGIRRMYKSRYDAISAYIYHCSATPKGERCMESLSDVPCAIDQEVYEELVASESVDATMAYHIAHLFARDPLVLFGDSCEVDDESETEHFEQVNSSNWQSVRWKLPPPNQNSIDWRTEFRTTELQLTDFENAAMATFVFLVARVILSFDLNLYIPLSFVDENMKRSEERDAIGTQKFFFRKYMIPMEMLRSTADIASLDEAVRQGLQEDQILGPCSFSEIRREREEEEEEGGGEGTREEQDPSPPSSNSSGDGWLIEGEEVDAEGKEDFGYFINDNNNDDDDDDDDISLGEFSGHKETEAFSMLNRSVDLASDDDKPSFDSLENHPLAHLVEEMSIYEILMGKGDYFPGFIPLIRAYLDFVKCDLFTSERVDQYLTFLEKRASGELMTDAAWIRRFVTNHPAYQQDSVVSQEIAYDLILACQEVGLGDREFSEVIGDVVIKPIRVEDAYEKELSGRLGRDERSKLIGKYLHRLNR
jgi:glutamate--cysteine ligase catalytic subunit